MVDVGHQQRRLRHPPYDSWAASRPAPTRSTTTRKRPKTPGNTSPRASTHPDHHQHPHHPAGRHPARKRQTSPFPGTSTSAPIVPQVTSEEPHPPQDVRDQVRIPVGDHVVVQELTLLKDASSSAAARAAVVSINPAYRSQPEMHRAPGRGAPGRAPLGAAQRTGDVYIAGSAGDANDLGRQDERIRPAATPAPVQRRPTPRTMPATSAAAVVVCPVVSCAAEGSPAPIGVAAPTPNGGPWTRPSAISLCLRN